MRSSRRSRLLLSLAAALSIAVAGLGCGGNDGGGGGDSGEAKALLERAFAKQVGSGELELDVKADLEGGGEKLEGPMTLKIDGPYAQSTRRKLPRLDWDISFKGLGQNIRGGLIATADNGFVELQGETFELGEQAFASLARQYAAVQPARRQSLGTFGIDAASWLKDPELHEDGESIGGEPTREITGSVDVRKAVRDIVELTRSPRLRRQLERQGQPAPELPRPKDEDLDEIEDAVNEFDIEVNVDKNDVVRRFFTEIAFDVPGEQDGDDVDGGRVSLRYVLRKVNTSPVIRPPQNPKPLRQLLEGFGLGALGGGLDRR